MRGILMLSVLLILVGSLGMFVSAYDHNAGDISETFSDLVSWPNPSYLKSVTAEESYVTASKAALKQIIGFAYFFILGMFLLNYSMCMIAKEYYLEKKGKVASKRILSLLNIVIFLQIIGLICSFFQYKILDNLINLRINDTGVAFTIIAVLKYASWALGFLIGLFAIVNSKYFIRDKTYEYRSYTKDYFERLKSKVIQKMEEKI